MNPTLSDEPALASEPIRVLLAYHHPLLCRWLHALLSAEPDIDVVAEASDGFAAVQLCQQHTPHVAVLDQELPDISGLETSRRIHTFDLPPATLITTFPQAGGEEAYLLRVLQAGASGYCHQQEADRELAPAIRTVHRGDVFLYPSGIRLFLGRYPLASTTAAANQPLPQLGLTPREAMVLRSTAAGASLVEVGRQLQLSPRAIQTAQRQILGKLGLNQRVPLVSYGVSVGLLQPGAGNTG